MEQQVDDQQQQVTRLFRSSVPEWEQIYNRADVYSTIYQRRRTTSLSFVTAAGLSTGSSILEVGCGPGLTTVALAREGYGIHAMDIVPEMVLGVQRRAAEAGVCRNVLGSVGDVRALAFRDCQFDLVIVVGVTEWIQSLPTLLQEISRVTKLGGYVVIASDNAWALHLMFDPMNIRLLAPARRWTSALISKLWHREATPNTYAYSPGEFRSSMRHAGLVTVKTRAVGFGPFSFMRRRILPKSLAVLVDRGLQALADNGLPLLQSAGHVYVTLARKVSDSSVTADTVEEYSGNGSRLQSTKGEKLD